MQRRAKRLPVHPEKRPDRETRVQREAKSLPVHPERRPDMEMRVQRRAKCLLVHPERRSDKEMRVQRRAKCLPVHPERRPDKEMRVQREAKSLPVHLERPPDRETRVQREAKCLPVHPNIIKDLKGGTMLLDELNSRRDLLEKIIALIQKRTAALPDARMWSSRSGEKVNYYLVDSEGNKKYINSSNKSLIQALAQREYESLVFKKCKKELYHINKLTQLQEEKYLLTADNKISDSKRKWIQKYQLSDDEFRANWEAKQYEGKGFEDGSQEIYTDRGERVRSKSEKIVADFFFHSNIPYKYEKPIILNGLTVYADFSVLSVKLRKEFVVELFGMMDNPEYAAATVRKIDTYARAGYIIGKNLIPMFESSQIPISVNMLKAIKTEYFM